MSDSTYRMPRAPSLLGRLRRKRPKSITNTANHTGAAKLAVVWDWDPHRETPQREDPASEFAESLMRLLTPLILGIAVLACVAPRLILSLSLGWILGWMLYWFLEPTDPENLHVLCRPCHSRQGTRPWTEEEAA